MTRDELDHLLQKVRVQPSELLESEVLEFKEYRDSASLNNSKELAEEVVALANHRGGDIVIGVRDSSNIKNSDWDSQVVGFPLCDVVEIRERLSGRINPKIEIRSIQHECAGKYFLVLSVDKRIDGLVATSSGKVYIRDGRSSRPMSPEEISAAVKSHQNYDWTAEVLKLDVQSSLDAAFVEEARVRFCELRKVRDLSTPSFLEAIGATRNGHLTKGGLLFLGRANVIRDVAGILEFRFSWKNKSGDLLVNDVWEGCLWEAVKRTRVHFDSCNSFLDFEWEGVKHGIPMLDAVAFHEAYLNALAHRDYSKDGMVAVEYFGNKMTVSSPGSFYGGVTSDNIFKHQPRHRNKALAKILMDFNLVDRAGMGVRRMSLRSLIYGRKFPQFSERHDHVEVVMDAEYMRPAIFVVANERNAQYGVAELLVLNCVYSVGAVSVEVIEDHLRRVSDDSWQDIQDVVKTLPHVEFVGTRAGIYVQVKQAYSKVFDVSKRPRPSRVSPKLIELYKYLRKHGSASNGDLCGVLGYAHSSQTSGFLRKTEFVERAGDGPAAVWRLTKSSAHT